MTVKPLHDKVLVKAIEESNTTASGIIIPDSSTGNLSEGEVVAVGNGYRLQDGSEKALEVKVGNKVMFQKHAATEIKVEGEKYLIMKEESILVVL